MLLVGKNLGFSRGTVWPVSSVISMLRKKKLKIYWNHRQALISTFWVKASKEAYVTHFHHLLVASNLQTVVIFLLC